MPPRARVRDFPSPDPQNHGSGCLQFGTPYPFERLQFRTSFRAPIQRMIEDVIIRCMGISETDKNLIRRGSALTRDAGFAAAPSAIAAAGERAFWRFVEFFTAQIRNKNTRRAYGRAVRDFFDWCEAHGIARLEDVNSVVVAGYIEDLGGRLSKPSVKQHLAA